MTATTSTPASSDADPARSWDELLASYANASNAAPATITSHLARANAFRTWAPAAAVADVDGELLGRHMDSFDWSPTTRRMTRAALRAVLEHAVELGVLPANPAAALYAELKARTPLSSRAPEAWQQLLAHFEEHAAGTEQTIHSHVMRAKTFARWSSAAPAEVDGALVAKYLARENWSKASRDAARVSLRVVFAHAVTARLLRHNPADVLPPLELVPGRRRSAADTVSVGSAGEHIDARTRLRVSAQAAHPARAWARANGLAVSRNGKLSGDILAAWQAAGAPMLAVGDDAEQTWAELLADYELTLRARGVADSSIQQRRWQLMAFVRWCRVAPGEVDEDMLVRYLANPDWAPQTRRAARSAFVGLFRHATRKGWIDDNPAWDLESVRVPRAVPRPAPERVVSDAAATEDARLQLMVMLAAQDGLRRAEVARARIEDFTAEGLRVRGKGGKVRLLPVHPELREVLNAYQAITGIRAGYLFPGQTNGHLSPDRVGRLLSRHLAGSWTAHTLRHRFTTQSFAATKDLRAVQELAGHASPTTTAGYVAVLDANLVQAVAVVPRVLRYRPAEESA